MISGISRLAKRRKPPRTGRKLFDLAPCLLARQGNPRRHLEAAEDREDERGHNGSALVVATL